MKNLAARWMPLLLIALSVPANAERSVDDASAFASDTDQWMKGALEEVAVVPGMAIAVVVGDRIVLARGYGVADIDANTPATADTQFYIASATKSYTALLAAILDARGTLKLDSPLSEHLHGAHMNAALQPDNVKLRDLLTHTSGVDNGPIGYRVAFSGEHNPELLWGLLDHSTATEDAPLGTYSYTNVDYNIYGMIQDREVGVSWQDQLHAELFQPMGMPRTTAYASLGIREGWSIAAPHFGLHPDGVQRLSLQKKDNTMQSAGGLMTTANDVARWLQFQINDGRLDGRQIVDAEVVRSTHAKLADAPEGRSAFQQTGYGLGWAHGSHREHAMLSHGGGFAGFRSIVSFMPEKRIGVAVLVNEGSIGGQLMGLAVTRAYDWWLDEIDATEDPVAELATMTANFRERMVAEYAKRAEREWMLARPNDAYVGTYVHDLYGSISISEEGIGLRVQNGNLACLAENFTKPESIRVELLPGSGEVILFEPADGDVDRFVYDGDTFHRVASR